MRTEQNIYKRKDGRWEGRYFKEYDINGKIKYSSVYAKSYNEVKEKLISAKSNVLNHRIKRSKTDFKDVCYEWLESKKEKIKLSSYSKYGFAVEKYIIPNFKKYKLYELDNNSLCDLMIKNNRLSQCTLKHISTVFKSIVLFANNKYNANIELNQYHFAKSNEEVVKTLSVSEQEKLVKYLLNRTNYIKLGILLCLCTGLRIGEVCALKWSDIDLENGILRVNKTMQRIQSADKNCKSKTQIIIQAPKSSKSLREIPLSKEILVIFNKCRKMHYRDFYFLTGSKNYIEPRTLQNQFKKHLEFAGIKDINFHALRHTFATRAIESGIDVKSVSEILGHSSVNMTLQKYVHISMEQKKREINKLKLF